MFGRRAPVALLLAVSWLSAVLHGDLEAIGWMLDHDHGHSHARADTHVPLTSDDAVHEPVFARQLSPSDHLGFAPKTQALGVVGLIGLLTWLVLHLRPHPAEPWKVPRRRSLALSSSWQFAWRCAPDSAAPPALS